jgi:hypothetical protein
LVGWVVDRRELVWPVSVDVVVAVDMKLGVSVRVNFGTGRRTRT